MDTLSGDQIAQAHLAGWRQLALGLHARCRSGGCGVGARFLAAVREHAREALPLLVSVEAWLSGGTAVLEDRGC